MENKNETFSFIYSAAHQEEIKNIQKKYMPEQENKLDLLRRLDKSVEKPGSIIALIIGCIGTLLFGLGMSCTMVWSDNFFVFGIIIGIIGMILLALAYPIFTKITKRQREKLAPRILELTKELMLNDCETRNHSL